MLEVHRDTATVEGLPTRGMLVHTCHPSTWEAEVGETVVLD